MRAPLLRWYARHARDLPWRRTRDPYAIWVSEIMLQQTQVRTVLPYYERFLERFPDVASLAAANEEEVLAAWSGLGYYRRARALHAGARLLLERHSGVLPGDAETLRTLPGIGRYTAGAIASIAFGRPEPVLDGNVRRVLARVLTLDDDRTLWAAAAELVRGDRPGRLNEALMELGALVCTAAAPNCSGCPVRGNCRAHARGCAEDYPRARARPSPRSVVAAVAWIERAGRVLLERPADGSPLRGTWDLPATEITDDADPASALGAKLQRARLDVTVGSSFACVPHGIMNRKLTLEVFDCRLRRGRVAGRKDLLWVSPGDLPATAHSGATRKIAATVANR
jgi:A/G-specific adenine glycosylase